MSEPDRQSIYEYMAENLRGDALPEDFSLPSETGTAGDLRWADGAMDGIYIYHTAHGDLPEDTKSRVRAAVEAASGGEYDAADRAFGALAADFRAIALRELLLTVISDGEEEWDAGNIYRYAIHLMIESCRREEVKLGLIMMELFDTDRDVLRDIVRSLGLSDEFTLFSVLNIFRWEQGMEEILELAKRVHGWGRIHAVERLEPVTEEIRSWLLKEGIQNTVMPEYSALTVFEKADVSKLLFSESKEICTEDFSAIGEILAALLREGPVTGISGVEHPEEVLGRFLDLAVYRTLSVRDYECISQIYFYASGIAEEAAKQDEGNSTDGSSEEETHKAAMEELSMKAVQVLRKPGAEEVIRAGLSQGEGIELAVALGIPCHRELLTLMEQDFEKYYGLCAYLMDNVVYSEAVLALYRKHIPWDKLEDDPRDETKIGAEFTLYIMLDSLLQAMGGDCRTAGDILLKTLSAPTPRTRYLTLQCLKEWTKAAEQPLSALSERISEKLREVYGREARENLKAEMKELLDS